MVCKKRFSALYEIHLIKTILHNFFIKIVMQFLCTFQKALLLFSRMLYTTSPTCILYQPNEKNKLTITYHIFELKKHCHFLKKRLSATESFPQTTLCLENLQRENRGKPAVKLCAVLECLNKSRFKNQNNYLGEIDDQIKFNKCNL